LPSELAIYNSDYCFIKEPLILNSYY